MTRLVAALLCTVPAVLAAQTRVATTDGVYSDEQAARGRDVYLGNCKSCHAPESHTGDLFRNAWHGRPLADLFTYVSTLMPKNEPGSLSPQENADVVAYLLKLNRIPAGVGEILPDSTRLRSIRIDAPSPAAVRKDP